MPDLFDPYVNGFYEAACGDSANGQINANWWVQVRLGPRKLAQGKAKEKRRPLRIETEFKRTLSSIHLENSVKTYYVYAVSPSGPTNLQLEPSACLCLEPTSVFALLSVYNIV